MVDFPLNLCDEEERWTWFESSLWLSLDQFERFWPDIGLVLDNGEAVKTAVRDSLRIEYGINARNRARWAADPTSPDELDETAPTEELAKICFRTMAERAGIHDVERVAAWLTGPVLASNKESGWHYIWNMLLYRMGADAPRKLVAHGIPSSIAEKLVAIAVRHRSEVDAIEDRIEATEEEPLSEWDTLAYADYQWDSAGTYPLRRLRSLFKYLSFERKWPEVMRCLQPTYIDALIQWGRANVGPKDELYERVTMPDDVRATWHQAWAN